MTQVGQLMMLKSYPFLTVIRSFELRLEFETLLESFDKRILPKKYQTLNANSAEWFIRSGHRKFRPCQVLTKLINCCKEYSSIVQSKSA